MATGRMIKKIISTSRKVANLKTTEARLLYTWIIPHLDIEGRFSAEPEIVKGYIVPRLKEFTITKIEEYLKDMAINNLIILYKINEDSFLQLNNFFLHNKVRPEREALSNILPPPTPVELQGNSYITPQQGKGEVEGKSKDKLSKDKLSVVFNFEKIWELYPKQLGKKEAIRHFNASVICEQDWLDINKALKNYLVCSEVKKGFIKNGSTWFNNWRDWINFTGIETPNGVGQGENKKPGVKARKLICKACGNEFWADCKDNAGHPVYEDNKVVGCTSKKCNSLKVEFYKEDKNEPVIPLKNLKIEIKGVDTKAGLSPEEIKVLKEKQKADLGLIKN